MIKLVEFVTHQELISCIIKQFAFMKIMSEPDDNNYNELEKLSLDKIYEEADNYFVKFTYELGIITSSECDLQNKLTIFLNKYDKITDTTAIQQNIQYELNLLDKDI